MRFRFALPALAALLAVAAVPPAATAATASHADHASPAEQVGARVAHSPLQLMVITAHDAAIAYTLAPLTVVGPQSTIVRSADSLTTGTVGHELMSRAEPPGAISSPRIDVHDTAAQLQLGDDLLIATVIERRRERSRDGEGVSMSRGGPSLEGRHPLGGGAFRRLAPPAA